MRRLDEEQISLEKMLGTIDSELRNENIILDSYELTIYAEGLITHVYNDKSSIELLESLPDLNESSALNCKLGELYMKHKNFEKAEKNLLKALEMNNYEKDNYSLKVNSLIKKLPEKFTEWKYFEGSLINTYLYLGKLYEYKEEFDKSIKYYEHALELRPNTMSARIHLANIYITLGEYDYAKSYLDSFNIFDENIEQYHSVRLRYNLKLKKYKECVKNIISIVELKNNKDIDKKLSDYEKNIIDNVFRDYLSKNPNIAEFMTFLKETIEEEFAQKYANFFILKTIDYFSENLRTEYATNKLKEFLNISDDFRYPSKKGILRLFEASRNIVKESPEQYKGLLNKEYIFKFASKGKNSRQLINEYIANIWLDVNILHHTKDTEVSFIKPTKPVLFVPDKEYDLIIEEKIAAPCLSEVIDRKEKDLDIGVGIATLSLSLLHLIGTSELNKKEDGHFIEIADSYNNKYSMKLTQFDYEKNFLRRAVNGSKNDKNPRLGKNENFNDFYKEIIKILPTDRLNLFIHSDAYPENVLSNGTWIDLETACIGDPGLDLAQLTCNHHYYNPDTISVYLENFKIASKETEINIKEEILNKIIINYDKNILYDNICQIGAMLSRDAIPESQFYLDKVLQRMQGKLKDSFVDYIIATKHEELKKVLR